MSNEECMYQSMFNFVELYRINISESESSQKHIFALVSAVDKR